MNTKTIDASTLEKFWALVGEEFCPTHGPKCDGRVGTMREHRPVRTPEGWTRITKGLKVTG